MTFKAHYTAYVPWMYVKRRSECLKEMRRVFDPDVNNISANGRREWLEDTGYCLDRTDGKWPIISPNDFLESVFS